MNSGPHFGAPKMFGTRVAKNSSNLNWPWWKLQERPAGDASRTLGTRAFYIFSRENGKKMARHVITGRGNSDVNSPGAAQRS
jgi:hypothetical protein